MEGYKEFLELQKWFMEKLDKVDMKDGHKNYEGAFELFFSYPNYFEYKAGINEPDLVTMKLHCYVIGPSRHYMWSGTSLKDVVKKAKKDIAGWD